MNTEEKTTTKRTGTKVLACLLAVLLMAGIAFLVATLVHKNSAQPVSNIKNGLSAYELAVANGYDGSVDEWLTSLKGKSAYDIVVENGYKGTEKDWVKSVEANGKQKQAGISTAKFSDSGDLMITLTDGTSINVGQVAGSDGKNGADGKDGKNGTNGTNGKDGANGLDGKNGTDGQNGTNGTNGKDGADGKDGTDGQNGADGTNGRDGVSIQSARINEQGQLVLSYSDGTSVNLDKVVGTNGKDGVDGKDGINGVDGQDGVGIQTITITTDGKLQISLSNGTTLDLGTIKGEKGDKGDTGTAGKDGVNGVDGKDGTNGTDGKDGTGISAVEINAAGELVLSFSDGRVLNLGSVKGEKGDKGDTGTAGKDGVNGVDGKDGTNGTDGKDGADGVGISSVRITDQGALTVTLTNGTVLNLGNIRGADGIGITACRVTADGELELTYTDGRTENVGRVTGTDGTGIQSVTLSADGELLVTLTDNTVTNLGNIKGAQGEKGEKGDKGDKGDPGRGIAKTELVDGELMITYTDGTTESAGKLSIDDIPMDYLDYKTIGDGEVEVSLNSNCLAVSGTIKIPSEHNGSKVVQIASNGFTGSKAKQIVLPDTIRQIGRSAFSSCSNLTKINIPAQVKTLPSGAFERCTQLKEITIPASITLIGQDCFFNAGIERAIFENPQGWSRHTISSSVPTDEEISSENMSNPEIAAKLLTEKIEDEYQSRTYSFSKSE